MENANSSVKTLDCELSCLEGDFESVMLYSKEDLEEEIKEDLEEEEEEDDLEYFNTFSTREELEYHEYLLKNPQPSWIRAKVRKGNLSLLLLDYELGIRIKKETVKPVNTNNA
ncbi:hypothetical protein Tco_0142587 [Tanacetum coccineum]